MRIKIIFYFLNLILGALVAAIMFFIMDFIDFEIKKIDGIYTMLFNSINILDVVEILLLLLVGTISFRSIFLINKVFLKKTKAFQSNSLTPKRGTIVAGIFLAFMIGACLYFFIEMAFTKYEPNHTPKSKVLKRNM